MLDYTGFEQSVITAAAALMPVVTGFAIYYIRAHTKDKALADLEVRAVQAGGGVAYNSLTAATAAGGVDFHAAKMVALTEGIAAAREIAGDIPSVAAKIDGSLGALRASDPSVSSQSAPVPAAVTPQH